VDVKPLAGEFGQCQRVLSNWIEYEFTALRYLIFDGGDYPSHSFQELAISRYIRWINR
jgi:hypothetical protein